MLHLALHRNLVVRIASWFMGCLCLLASLESLQPTLLFAGALKVSWTANTEPDLAGYKIYYGRATGDYNTSIDIGNVTQYTVNQLNEGVTYFFVVTAYDLAGNESAFSKEVSALVPAIDRTPPTVTSVQIVDQNTVEVKFSESVSSTSAQNRANYTIKNGISISSAILQSDNRTVILSTSPHESGKNYSIVIQGIADRAPVPNVMTQAATFTYTYRAADTRPPVAATFRVHNQQSLEVGFDETVSVASAENKANYSINNNVSVLEAKLQADGKTVILTTSLHATGVNYTLTVRSIADRATTPNIMSQPAFFNYSFQAVDNTPPLVASVRAVDQTTVEVLFSEPVTRTSAQNNSNYAINKGIAISSAALQSDTRTVLLTTSAHSDGESYTLTVSGIS
ncbi:MAG: fibronectin type III domain-containing protein, partial [candidate division KSB1 bacterium]|nr:fibronectin type III domain-containing protein [candidate division KSB1 bacterium]